MKYMGRLKWGGNGELSDGSRFNSQINFWLLAELNFGGVIIAAES